MTTEEQKALELAVIAARRMIRRPSQEEGAQEELEAELEERERARTIAQGLQR